MSSGSGFKVTVLCPTGHRVTVKVSRESPVLEILSEVCRKRGLDPAKHRLKHHKTMLDNGLSVRFANLPNNANLEMEELQEALVTSGKPVRLAVQAEGKPRVIMEVADDLSLFEAVRKAEGEAKDAAAKDGEEPVVVYMRRELVGEAELRKVTLKDLGIVSGMSAAVRLMYKKPEVLKEQAHVIPAAVTATTTPSDVKEQVWRPMKKDCDITLDKIVGKSPPANVPSAATTAAPAPTASEAEPMDTSRTDTSGRSQASASDPEPEKPTQKKMDLDQEPKAGPSNSQRPSSSSAAFEAKVKAKEEPPVLNYQGASNCVVFKVGEGGGGSSAAASMLGENLSDDFFEMTIDDVKLLYKDNKRLIKELDEGQELLTKGMRQSRREGQKLTLLQKYKKCLIRVQFGARDGGLVVQCPAFSPGQTVAEVKEVLRDLLAKADMRFSLYTTPPKKVLDAGSNLLDNDCVPAALLHFQADEPEFKDAKCLKPDLLLSNSAGVEQAVQDSGVRRSQQQAAAASTTTAASFSDVTSIPSTSSYQQQPVQKKRGPPESDSKKDPENKKVPKWLAKGKQ